MTALLDAGGGFFTMALGDNTAQSSTTALAVLSAIAVAGSERDAGVRFDDPIASRLLRWSDGKYAAARMRALHPLMRRAMERQVPGGYGYSIARMHHMDAVVRTELRAGLDTLVILGAGYDTRPYRMREGLNGVAVIEVDHPATSRDKRERVAKALGALPPGVSYLEVDFSHQDLLDRLADHDHELSARTLFILSGVAMYLTEAAVLRLFDQIAAHSSPRTSLLFDYVYSDVFTNPERYYSGPEWVPFVAGVDEEARSGFAPGHVGKVLASHGLRLDSHIDSDRLTERYLRRADGSIAAIPHGFAAIAHAFVAANTSGCRVASR
jgi:methyltransferase (TIGR00027 family)